MNDQLVKHMNTDHIYNYIYLSIIKKSKENNKETTGKTWGDLYYYITHAQDMFNIGWTSIKHKIESFVTVFKIR